MSGPAPAEVGALYLADVARRLAKLKENAEGAMAQVSDAELVAAPDPETNSIAITVKHVAGNLRSRFTDFLVADGEKPGRDRDAEFTLAAGDDRAALLAAWEASWALALGTVRGLAPADLVRTVHIRGEPHAVVEALNRHLAHLAYHTGQIVQLAKHYAGSRWRTLSIPRGGSAAHTAEVRAGQR